MGEKLYRHLSSNTGLKFLRSWHSCIRNNFFLRPIAGHKKYETSCIHISKCQIKIRAIVALFSHHQK